MSTSLKLPNISISIKQTEINNHQSGSTQCVSQLECAIHLLIAKCYMYSRMNDIKHCRVYTGWFVLYFTQSQLFWPSRVLK